MRKQNPLVFGLIGIVGVGPRPFPLRLRQDSPCDCVRLASLTREKHETFSAFMWKPNLWPTTYTFVFAFLAHLAGRQTKADYFGTKECHSRQPRRTMRRTWNEVPN